MINASMIEMISTCDINYNCGGYWASKVASTSFNFHFEEICLELVLAFKMSLVGINETVISSKKNCAASTAPYPLIPIILSYFALFPDLI